LNNVGALQYRPGQLEEARDYFEKALERTKEEASEDDTYYSQIAISIR
jgi:RNA polymerase-associated protein CTR9